MTTQPVTPYGGTIGHSGSSTSKARAVRLAATGQASNQQADILSELARRGYDGMTVGEVRRDLASFKDHHGTASGTLSTLHKAARIDRLAAKRGGTKIYVLPLYVAGRPTEAQGRAEPSPVVPLVAGATPGCSCRCTCGA